MTFRISRLKKSCIALSVAALCSFSITPAFAQTAKFEPARAAHCVSTFMWIYSQMSPEHDDQALMQQTAVLYKMWEFEFLLATKDLSEAQITEVIQQAQKIHLEGKTPPATAEEFQVLVNYFSDQASTCGGYLSGVYPDGNHPVIEKLIADQQGQPSQTSATSP